MGTPYRYSPWQPVDIINSTSYGTQYTRAKSLYYGNLFTSTALAGGNKQVSILVNETSFTAYGIYDAGSGGGGRFAGQGSKLQSIVVVNLGMWNSTQEGSRPYTEVRLPIDRKAAECATVKRLTAPGVEVQTGITLAGQSVGTDGSIVGREVVERLGSGGTVLVGASEAVLITL
jgi:hypothetical protein